MEADISCISRVLCNNATLGTLWLGECRFDAVMLAGGMIQVYDTSHQIDDPMRGLIEALKVNRSLKELHLKITYYVESAGREAFIGAFQNIETLTRLRLCNGDYSALFSLEELREMGSRV